MKAGDNAADFTLRTDKGTDVRLSDFKGKKVVLYFYPKDDTPGCTKEACGFRDVYDDILEAGAVVIGVSPDGENSHTKFRDKYDLPFFLLCDEEHKVAEMYGAWGEKKLYGKAYFGILRSTFILDENSVILKAFPNVSPDGHAEEVLKVLEENR